MSFDPNNLPGGGSVGWVSDPAMRLTLREVARTRGTLLSAEPDYDVYRLDLRDGYFTYLFEFGANRLLKQELNREQDRDARAYYKGDVPRSIVEENSWHRIIRKIRWRRYPK